MTQIKFYRVETLPEVGEVGSLYFVYGSGGVQSLLYICVGDGLFELYTPDLYELENKIDSLEDSVSGVETKIDESTTTLSNKIDNIQVDLSPVAKQGDNTEATNTAILAAIKSLSSAYLVKNTDGDNTYTLTIKSMTSMRVDGDTIIV